MKFAAAVLGLLLFGTASFAEDGAQNLVEGAVARHGALKSGRLTYSYEEEIRQTDEFRKEWIKAVNKARTRVMNEHLKKTPPDDLKSMNLTDGVDTEFIPPGPKSFSFSGNNWSLGSAGEASKSVEGSFQGIYFHYNEFHTTKVAGLTRELRIFDDADGAGWTTVLPNPPVYAGTFWMAEQAAFVKEHSKDFRLKGVRAIDGVETRICDYELPLEVRRLAVKRTKLVTEPLFGGAVTLRLYIAQQLGHVLPMIEYLDEHEVVETRFTASNFSEASPGLWLPASIEKYRRDATGEMRSSGTTKIKYELINLPIPEKDFVIDLEPGTRVFDNRNWNYLVYDLRSPCSVNAFPPLQK